MISRLSSPAVLDENDILQRAASQFRLRARGDLDAVVAAQMPPPPPPLTFSPALPARPAAA